MCTMYKRALLLCFLLFQDVSFMGLANASSLTEEEDYTSSLRRNLIIDGTVLQEEDIIPNFALITGTYTTNGAEFICGGALIERIIVLTSAVCLNNTAVDISNVEVHVNVSSRGDDDDGKHVRRISKYISHPDFDYDSDDWYKYDIAVVLLNETISTKIAILEYNTEWSYPPSDSPYIVPGFGTTSETSTELKQVPHQADLKEVNHGDCNAADAWYKNKLNASHHICATDAKGGSQDTCIGDTGAPLLYFKNSLYDLEYDPKYVVVGITSGGDGCGRSEVPGFYTRVSHHAEFINQARCEMTKEIGGVHYTGCNYYCYSDPDTNQCIPNKCLEEQPHGMFSNCNAECKCVGICFSGLTLVEMEDGRSVQMKELRLGDKVLVAEGKYEPVYSFGHYTTSGVTTEYLRIRTKTSTGDGLEISPDHLIITEDGQPIQASALVVGDKVRVASSKHGAEEVSSIQKVVRSDMFAPFTPSGTIVTNGIQSSCFVTLQDEVELSLGGVQIPLTYHQLGLMFESPHRLICHFWMDRCERYETYDEDGISNWVALPLKGSIWLTKQNIMISGPIFILLFAFFYMINVVEMVVMCPLSTSLTLLMAITTVFVAHFLSPFYLSRGLAMKK